MENQLSKEKKQSIAIVPELTNAADKSGVSFFEFIPRETVLAMKDFLWVRERIQVVREEALSPQALAAYEGEKTELMNLELKLIDGAELQYGLWISNGLNLVTNLQELHRQRWLSIRRSSLFFIRILIW